MIGTMIDIRKAAVKRIEERLNEDGFRVQTEHLRRFTHPSGVVLARLAPHRMMMSASVLHLEQTGGQTIVRLVNVSDPEDPSVYAQGVATCHPADHFSRFEGRELALERAVVAMVLRRDFGEALPYALALSEDMSPYVRGFFLMRYIRNDGMTRVRVWPPGVEAFETAAETPQSEADALGIPEEEAAVRRILLLDSIRGMVGE